MQQEYIEQLPPDLQQLVQDTEQAIGFRVEVVLGPNQAKGAADLEAPLACEVELSAARVLVPAVDQFRPSSVFHELQHIRRVLVEGVPRLVDCEDYEPWSPTIGTALTKHDNAFEHLVIVPRELQAFPDRREHWEAVMTCCWAEIASAQGDGVARRQLDLACGAFLQHVLPNSPKVGIARAALVASNDLERAELFCAALLPLLQDKEAAIRVWFAHQKIPLEMAALQYFRPLEYKAWVVPLAT